MADKCILYDYSARRKKRHLSIFAESWKTPSCFVFFGLHNVIHKLIVFSCGCGVCDITIAIRQEVVYLSSNGTTNNVVRHDIDLHFQGLTFLNVNISKTVRFSENTQ